MKELFSYQEIGTLIDQRIGATFTRHIVVRVTVIQPRPDNETEYNDEEEHHEQHAPFQNTGRDAPGGNQTDGAAITLDK